MAHDRRETPLVVMRRKRSDGRLDTRLLERAESAVLEESAHGDAFSDGCANRQPELCTWLIEHLHALPLPLDRDELARVGTCLFAVIYVFDEQISGRQIR